MYSVTGYIITSNETVTLITQMVRHHSTPDPPLVIQYTQGVTRQRMRNHCTVAERSLMVRWVVGSILHGVDPLSYFSF